MVAHIALTGRSGSGKTEVAGYLAQRHGYVRVGTGNLCRRICQDLFASESKTLMNAVTDALRAIQPDVWLTAALRHAPVGPPLVVDSMRFREDHLLLKSRGYTLWRIEAPREMRWERLRRRGQDFDGERDDHALAEVDLGNAPVDHVFTNDRHLTDLWDQVEAALTDSPHQAMRSGPAAPGGA